MTKNILALQSSIAASGSVISSPILLTQARTLTIWCSVVFDVSATSGAEVRLQTSPNGQDWDTLSFGVLSITLTANATVQGCGNIDPPEHGYMRFKVTNLDSSTTITKMRLWYAISTWADTGKVQRGGEIPTRPELIQ